MQKNLQEGIFYSRKPRIGQSFLLIFLHANSTAEETGRALQELWKMYQLLKTGVIEGLDIDIQHRRSGNLSVLFGYGPKVFSLQGIRRKKPDDFDERYQFFAPGPYGGGEILAGGGIRYSDEVFANHALTDEIIVQIISDNEFYSSRALVETGKKIYRMRKQHMGIEPIGISAYYPGFQRPDQRNWLGFHDGVSNLKSNERRSVICINSSSVKTHDKWLVDGTYLAFLRISLDLLSWEDVPVEVQELIIGRDKLTGCPLKLDRSGVPRKDSRCPVPGTSEVIDRGNESFREIGTYSKTSLGVRASKRGLENSHISQMRPPTGYAPSENKSFRIFRQGFEFISSALEYPKFKVGLNFVSFQSSPERLFGALAYALRPKSLAMKRERTLPSLDRYMSIHSAGIFLVPPCAKDESFPGSNMFLEDKAEFPTKYRPNSQRGWLM